MYSSKTANGGYLILENDKPVEAAAVVELLNGFGQNADYVARVSYEQVRDQLLAERTALEQDVAGLQDALADSAADQTDMVTALDDATQRTAELQAALDAKTGGRWAQIEIEAAKWRALEAKEKAEVKP